MARVVLPLAVRVPNPPAVFVGRDDASERLAERLRRGPLAIAHGPDGAGKLAVVLHVLHKRFKSRVAHTLMVRGRADEPIEQSVVRVLASVAGLPRVPTGDVAEVALDLAEAAGAWIVVDGAHDPAWAFAGLVARYARTSRWVLTGTPPPTADVLEHAVAIGPLTEDELGTLAATWHPELAIEERVLGATAARGSPWRLRQLLAERLARGGGVLTSDAPGATRVLATLATLEQPVTAALLLALTEAPPATLTALDERALLVHTPSGIELHAAARALLGEAARTTPALAAALAPQLAATHAPALIVEAVRLALGVDDVAQARAWLDIDGVRVLEAGLAGQLARALTRADTAPALAGWRLRVALDLGDGDRIRALAGAITDEDRLLWAEGLHRAGLFDDAIAAARTITGRDEVAAQVLIARALGMRGEMTAALAMITTARARATAPAERATITVHTARLAAIAGDARQARLELRSLPALDDVVTEPVARDLLYAIASCHHDLGELAEAESALAALERRIVGDPLAPFVRRRVRLIHAAIDLDRGQLTRGGTALDEIEHATSRTSVHRPFLALLRAQRALLRGEVGEVAAASAAVAGPGYLEAWSVALLARAALLDPTLPRRTAHGDGMWPQTAALHEARAELRAGEPVVPRELACADVPVETWLAAQALAWEHALLHDAAAGSRARALEVADEAARRGMHAWEIEALLGACDATIVLATPEDLGPLLARVATLARTLESPRFLAEHAALLEFTGAAAPGALERIAAGPPSPAARRARWLLGDRSAADALDRSVCQGLGVRRAIVLAGSALTWRPGWGVDTRTRSAWLPDGTTVGLADKPQLWRLLEVLSSAPAGLDKEAIVTQTWGVAYHPLRHDKRLHNAIHKLRKLLEDEPTSPTRIPTTVDGYRLGDAQPVRLRG